MDMFTEQYLAGTVSSICTRIVILGWFARRPNRGTIGLTQKEFANLLVALKVTP